MFIVFLPIVAVLMYYVTDKLLMDTNCAIAKEEGCNLLAFIIWSLCGCMFMGFGIVSFFAKKPVGFWAGSKACEVNDVKGYNHAMGILWCIFGVLFILVGVPLLTGQNSPLVMLSIFGVVVWAISLMAVYELVISRKYRKR